MCAILKEYCWDHDLKYLSEFKKDLWNRVSRNPLYDINKIWLNVSAYPYIKILILYPNGQQTMACGPKPAGDLFLYNYKLNMVLIFVKVKKCFN